MSTWSMREARAGAVRASWALRGPGTTPRSGWQQHQKCAGLPTDMFYSDNPRKARSICDGCPVRVDCIAATFIEEDDFPHDYWYGIRGGLTPTERRRAVGRERTDRRKQAAA